MPDKLINNRPINNRAAFEKVLQVGTVDPGNGTLFGYHDKRAVSNQRLMLIISSGGSGKSAIMEAITTARQKLSQDFSNFVKFIVVDSASDELEPLKKMGIDTLNISSSNAIDRLSPSKRSSYYKKFVPKDYPYQELNDQGSGQKRLHGKVKLYDKEVRGSGSTNDTVLVNKIKGLFEKEWKDYKSLPLDIMIISGLSGGNGSGTFMNIAALARTACQEANDVQVYGYLMLPDTAESFAREEGRRQRLYANGFAALKELESYMSIPMEYNRNELIERQGGEGDIVLGTSNPIFNYPVLLSGDYWDAVSVIAETIVNAAAYSAGAFTQRSFYSNRGSYKGLEKSEVSDNGILKVDACPEDSHSYCSIGYAYASIPEKIVIPNIVGKVAAKLYIRDIAVEATGQNADAFIDEKTGLTVTQFEKAMRILLNLPPNAQVTDRSLWGIIDNNLTRISSMVDNAYDVTYDDIVEGNANSYMRGFHTEERANGGLTKLTEGISTTYDGIINQARSLMLKYGPRIIDRLYNGFDPEADPETLQKMNSICMRTQMQTVLSEFNRLSQQSGRVPETLEPVGRFNIIGRFKKKEKLQEWESRARNTASIDIKRKISLRMGGEHGDWNNVFFSRYSVFVEKCRRFADVLETLSAFYKGRGISLDADDFDAFSRDGGGRNGVNLCSEARMYSWVKAQVASKVRQIIPAEVRDAFISDFFSNMEDWVSNEKGVARIRFDEVMSRVCGLGAHALENNGLELTIADYFEETLSGVEDVRQQQQEIDNMVDNIMTRLKGKSSPLVKASNVGQVHISILVPPSLTKGGMGSMIQKSFESRLTEGDQFAESSAVDAIVCYQTSVAIAVADLEDLTKWENAYDRLYDGQTHLSNGEYINLHIKTGYSQYGELTKTETDRKLGNNDGIQVSSEENIICGTGLSWRHYPSINVKRYYRSLNMDPLNAAFEGTTEGNYWQIFSKKIDQAVKYGIIECEKEEGNIYKYFINLIPSDWNNLNVSGYEPKDGGRCVRGRMLFEYLKKQNASSDKDYRRQIALTGSKFFGSEGFNLGEVQAIEGWSQSLIERIQYGYLKRMLRKMTGLYQDLEDTLYRYIDIERELVLKETEKVKYYDAQEFADWLLNGVIDIKDDKTWSVLVSADGHNVPIITFDRVTFHAKMKPFEKALTTENQKLAVVYLRYRQLLEKGAVKRDDLLAVKEALSGRIEAERDRYEAMLEKRLSLIAEAKEQYEGVVGSSPDPVGRLMDHFNMDVRDTDTADILVNFYKALKDTIDNLSGI